MKVPKKREDSMTVTLNDTEFRIKKYDAYTGSFIAFTLLQKALPVMFEQQAVSAGQLPSNRTLMSKDEFKSFLVECLRVAEIKKNAGYLPIVNDYGYLDTSIENDTASVLMLAVHALKFNFESFFSEGASLLQGILPVAGTSATSQQNANE